MKSMFLVLMMMANQAHASGMIWVCKGEHSTMRVISGWQSVVLHSATLAVEGEEVHFGWEQRNQSAQTQEFHLAKHTLIFIPLSDFMSSPDGAVAAKAVIYKKGQDIALDVLSCVGR